MNRPVDELPHPAPAGLRIYHWHGGLLLLASTLVLDRPTQPIAATLRIALRNPYSIEVEDTTLTTRASLVGSQRLRKRVTAIDSDVALFYLPIERPEHAGLRARLGGAPIIEFEDSLFDAVRPRIRAAFDGELSPAEVRELADDTLKLIAPADATSKTLDPRVQLICDKLTRTPLNEASLQSMAQLVHLSPSRLRALFRQQTGCAFSDYARWSAIWQAANPWRPDRTFTETAVEAGFFDLAHATRTFVEVFGMTPSVATDPRFAQLIPCDVSPPPPLANS